MPLLLVLAAGISMLLGMLTMFFGLQNSWHKIGDTATEYAERVRLAPRNWDFWTLEMSNLAEELQRERESIEQRKRDLDAYAQRLQAEKAELENLRNLIASLRDEINRSVITLTEAEKPNLKTLARTYASMKPAESAPILSRMDDEMVVKILSLMKPDVVANILTQISNLQPATSNIPAELIGSARAARISEKLRLLKQEQTQTP